MPLVTVALFVLATGLLTSISLMSGFHLLMVLAILFYLPKYRWKKFPKSGWVLLAFAGILILSVAANLPLIERPFKNLFKVKYYLIGVFYCFPYPPLVNYI